MRTLRITIRNYWVIFGASGWAGMSLGSLVWDSDFMTWVNVIASFIVVFGAVLGSKFSFLPNVMRIQIWGVFLKDFPYGTELVVQDGTLTILTTRLRWPLATPRVDNLLIAVKREYDSQQEATGEETETFANFLWWFG